MGILTIRDFPFSAVITEFNLCIGSQVVLSAILPHYLDYLKSESDSADSEDKVKAEVTALFSLVTSMNVLVKSSEVLTR